MPPSAISNPFHCIQLAAWLPSVLTPETTGMTTGSSIQASPEPIRGRELEAEQPMPPLSLPEPVSSVAATSSNLSRKTSSNSLGQSILTSPAASSSMAEALKGTTLVRRTSNGGGGGMRKATEWMKRRRPSSTHPRSRDGSVGPGVLRNALRPRSNSNTTLPPEHASALYTDSDDDDLYEIKDEPSALCP